ncbi:hypothetical protein V3C99_010767 [Haemonchus contortus]
MGEEEDESTPCANMDNEMRDILVLPTTHVPLHDTAQDQLSHFSQKLTCKMDEYKDFLGHNSVVVFAVNYIKNRFIPAELCAEIGKLFEILNVKTVAEFNKALESLRTDPETAVTVESFEDVVKRWNEFVNDIEKKLEEKVGPVTTTVDDDELPELGVGSKTISHYVKGSAFEMVLVVVVRSFNSAEVTQHIMGLYNKMDEFHKLGCDVYLLTRGPPIGSRGGGYIKLIGVPFRKLYDEEEALSELKAHRHSAVHFIGWESLLKTVEASLSDEMRPQSANKEQNEDQASFITQKGGTVLVDKTGKVLYKYVEDGNEKWPTVEQLIDEVKKVEPATTTTTTTTTTTKSKAAVTTTAKIDSEVSVKEVEEKKKPCCVIL